ncbi:MAG: PAS domain S-box protein [Betaproteobacteria bacterium]
MHAAPPVEIQPPTPVDPRQPGRGIVRVAGALSFAFGVLALAAWFLYPEVLQSIARERTAIKPNVAVGLALLGATLLLLGARRHTARVRQTARALLGLAMLLPLGTMLEYLLGIDLGIDSLIAGGLTSAMAHSGRMTPQTAMSLLSLAAASLLAISERRSAAIASQSLVLCALAVSVISLLAYLCDVAEFGGFASHTTMSIEAASALFVTAAGVLFLRTREGLVATFTGPGTTALVVRLLLATVWIATPLIAWLRLAGENRGWYGTQFGTALFALSQLVLLTAIILATGHLLARVDGKRRAAERAQCDLQENVRVANRRLEEAVAARTAELSASKARTDFILSNCPALIGYIDPELRYQFCNETYRTWFGIDPAAFIGQSIESNLGRDAFALFEKYFREALAGHRTTYERRIDGPVPRDVFVELVPAVGPGGQVEGIFVGASDITARRTAELARERTEALLGIVTGTSTACIGYLDVDLRFQFCNTTYEDWYGVSVQALLGRTIEEVIGVDDYVVVAHHYAAALAGRGDTYERRLQHQGQGRDILVTLVPNVEAGRIAGICVYSVDISDRVRSEAALRDSEERFRLVASGTLDGIWDWNVETGVSYYSPRYAEMLGYEPAEVPYDRKFFEGHLHPDDRGRTFAALQAHFDARQPYEVDYRLRTRAGDYLWCHARGQATWNAAGQPTRFTGAVRDISARRRAEEQSRLSTELLRQTERSVRVGGWELDLETMAPAWSEGTYLIHEIEPGTRPDLAAALDFYAPEGRPALEAAVSAAIEHGTPFDLELPFVTAKGNRLWVRARGTALQEGGKVVKLYGTLQDITERKEAANELVANRKLLAELIDSVPLPLIVKDDAHRFVLVNKALTDLLGHRADDVVGRTDADFHSSERARHNDEEDDTVLRTGQPLIAEQAFTRADGSERWVMKHKCRVNLPDGRQGVILTLLDLTERRQAELELERNRQFLQEVIEAIPQSAFVKDAEHRFVLFNDRFCQDMGADRKQLLDRSDLDFLPSDIARRNWEEDDAAMKSDVPLTTEQYHQTRGSAGVWVLKSQKGIVANDGSRYIVGIATDVTHLKRTETALRSSQARLRSLNELSSDWIWEQDESFRFTFQSESVGHAWGDSPSAFLGMTRWEAGYDGMTPDRWRDHRRTLEAHLPFHDLELSLTTSAGTRHESVSGTPVFDEAGVFQGYRGVGRDITARKEAELALQRNQAFLAEVMDAFPQPVFVKDAQHRWVLVNAAFCELMEADRAVLLGRSDPDVVAPELAQRVWAEDDAVMKSKQTLVVEEENFMRSRSDRRWLLKTKRRVDIADQAYLVGMSVDITGLKQVQAALQENEAQLRLLAENSNDLIFQLSPGGLVEYASPASTNLLGLQPKDLVGRKVDHLIHPDDATGVRGDFREVVVTGGAGRIATFRMRRPDGDWRWIEASFRVVREADSKLTAQVIGVARDADERVRVAAVLDRFKHVLDNTRDIIFMIDPHSLTMVYANQGAVDALGYDRPRLLQLHPWDLRDDIEEIEYRQGMDEFLRGELRYREFELTLRRADGSTFPGNAAMQLVERTGEDGILISVIRDATERKRIDRMKNEFVSTVSHELRTPLTSIRGSLGLIAGGAAGAIPEQASKLVQIAHDNSERLMRLINDILDIEKIESGRMRFDLKAHELEPVLARSIEMNRGYGEQLGVRFEIAGTIPEVRVLADADHFIQIMANLLSNAAKYSPRDAVVEVAAVIGDDMVRISVRDHGPGIPESFRDSIFGKFHQADSSDSRRKGGTGLGLSIVKALVENHGGQVGFETAAGAGTTFHFTLRIAPALTESAAVEAA